MLENSIVTRSDSCLRSNGENRTENGYGIRENVDYQVKYRHAIPMHIFRLLLARGQLVRGQNLRGH